MKDVIYISYSGGGTNPEDKWYIRLGAFLNFIKTDLMYYVKTSKGDSCELLNFNTDPEVNLMYVEDLQISTNPDVCVINRVINDNGANLSFIPNNQQAEEFISNLFDNYKCYGKIMNIYVNMKYILLTLESLRDASTGNVVLINFLNTILSSISIALGGVNNLEATIDENSNTVIIRDKNPLPDIDYVISKLNIILPDDKKMSTNNVIFDLYGYNTSLVDNFNTAGFIRDFSFTTELTPAFSTMITVGATANSTVVGENSTALSRLNWGYTDRFKKDIGYQNESIGLIIKELQTSQQVGGSTQYSDLIQELESKIEEQLSGNELKQKYLDAYNNYIEYIRELSLPSLTYNKDEPQTYSNSLKDFITYKQQLREVQYNYIKYYNPSAISDLPFAPSTGFIPFNMSLIMDGLSGMKIYNKFLIDTRYLPPNYTNACEFLIKNIEHNIENNKWTTKLESIIISKGNAINSGVVNSDNSLQQLQDIVPETPLSEVSETAKIIYDFFISKGFTSTQAAAWVGNLYQESKLDPTVVNSIGAIGIAQWLGSRKIDLLKKPNYLTLQVQLDFIWEELQSTEIKAYSIIKATNSLQEAVLAIRKSYERPGEAEANDVRRLSYAIATLKKYINFKKPLG